MKKLLSLIISLGLLMSIASIAHAEDTKLLLPIATAMNMPLAQNKLNNGIQFYFGYQQHPQVQKKLGTAAFPSDGRGKPGELACNRAFLTSMLAIENDARERGANAVVGIASFSNHHEMMNPTEFECHLDNNIATVSMKGDFVKIG